MLSMLCSNRESSVVGKEVTPFVLQRVNELTKGQSLQASILPLYNLFYCILSFHSRATRDVYFQFASLCPLYHFRLVYLIKELKIIPSSWRSSSAESFSGRNDMPPEYLCEVRFTTKPSSLHVCYQYYKSLTSYFRHGAYKK